MLLGALTRARAIHGGTSFVAEAEVRGDIIAVAFRRRVASDPAGSAVRVTVPEPVAYDELVFNLAAATLAAPMTIDGRTVRLDLLRA